MKGRATLLLLALAGLTTGVPFVVETSVARAQGGYTTNGDANVAPSLVSALGLWLLLGAVGIVIITICAIRRAPAGQQTAFVAPAAEPIPASPEPDAADQHLSRTERRGHSNRQNPPTSHASPIERHVA